MTRAPRLIPLVPMLPTDDPLTIDIRRGRLKARNSPHCCPICCTYNPRRPRDGHHAVLALHIDAVDGTPIWYCPNCDDMP